MLTDFVKAFDKERKFLEEELAKCHPDGYERLFNLLVQAINRGLEEPELDPERITKIDHGCYQGTLVFVVAARGYPPDDYWATHVSYGSCSGCDTLQGISQYSDKPPTTEQIAQYMTLILHLLQRMTKIT